MTAYLRRLWTTFARTVRAAYRGTPCEVCGAKHATLYVRAHQTGATVAGVKWGRGKPPKGKVEVVRTFKVRAATFLCKDCRRHAEHA